MENLKITIFDWLANGERAISEGVQWPFTVNLLKNMSKALTALFIKDSKQTLWPTGESLKPHTRCNVAIRGPNGKFISYKTLKESHPLLFKEIESLPPI